MSEGAGVVQVLPQVSVLVGMGVMFFLITIWRFRFKQGILQMEHATAGSQELAHAKS